VISGVAGCQQAAGFREFEGPVVISVTVCGAGAPFAASAGSQGAAAAIETFREG